MSETTYYQDERVPVCFHCGIRAMEDNRTICDNCLKEGHKGMPYAGCTVCAERDEDRRKEDHSLRRSVMTVMRDMALLTLLVLGFAALTGYCAPVPKHKPIADAESAFLQFVKDSQKGKLTSTKKKQLLSGLEELHQRSVRTKQGKQAELSRQYAILLMGIDSDKPWAFTDTKQALRSASMDGKYTHLLFTSYAPGDKIPYDDFKDFGHWPGTAYLGSTNLPHGFWVYVHPRWFVWKVSGNTEALHAMPTDN